MKSHLLLELIALLLNIQFKVVPVKSQLISPANVTCACPGDVLTYTCAVEGGNVTIWSGSAFDCAEREIVLNHDEFNHGTSGECNNGAIKGHSVSGYWGYYISQLDILVSDELNNKTVSCSSDSEIYNNYCNNNNIIGESWINVAAPAIVYLSDASEKKLEFSWIPVVSDTNCSHLHYNITSDCGSCPSVTNETIATCSVLQLTTNATECHFRVSSVVCDILGDPSSLVAVILKVPNVPQAKLIPSYSYNSRDLEMLYIITTMVQTDDFFNISGSISGIPTSYTTHISNPISGSSFNSTIELYQSSCEEASRCLIELPNSSYCSQSTIINVAISAANILGEGPPSNFTIECTNNFVQVLYRETTSKSTVSCVFLDPSDTSEKICCVTYQLCDQERTEKPPECNMNIPHNIKLNVSVTSKKIYCYTVTASNDTYTVKIEANFTTGFNQGAHYENFASMLFYYIHVPIIGMVLLGLLGIISVSVLYYHCTRRRSYQLLINEDRIHSSKLQNALKLYLIHYHLNSALNLHEVPSDYKLQEFITEILNVDHGFRRGHTYYEFTNETENILEGKEVLLQDKNNTEKWFQLAPPEEWLRFYGEGIAHSSFGDQYRVFIQSFGSGARHLPHDSWILYNHSVDQVQPDVLPLVPICSEHFAHKVIDSEGGLSAQQFCTQNRLSTAAFNLFLTVEHLPKEMRNQPPRDIILMDRVSGKFFTGPFARQILDPRNGGESQSEKEKWKVFVLLERNKQGLILQKNSEVLYQDSRYMNGKYSVLEVDEDCVRMSKFIETKPDCHYEDGKVFYEAKKEEDLLYYKKALRPQKKELGCEQLELQSLIEYFYAIDGVPANGVKLKDLSHCKIFIQSTSQGSRCLKKGDKLLYLKEYISSEDRSFQDDLEETHSDSPSEDEHRQ